MELIAEKIGKKYHRDWIFKDLSFQIKSGESVAVTGHNGAGKSTLLQVLSGILPTGIGAIHYSSKNNKVLPEDLYQHLVFASPYMELPEELTLIEAVEFHSTFKKLTIENFIEKINLSHAANKEIRHFSSGMKQKVKLGLALYSDTPLLILDEPTTNMDKKGVDWYIEEITKQSGSRTILIGSNQSFEYSFCQKEIKLS